MEVSLMASLSGLRRWVGRPEVRSPRKVSGQITINRIGIPLLINLTALALSVDAAWGQADEQAKNDQAQSATTGKAGGLPEVERLKAAWPFGRHFPRLSQHPDLPQPMPGFSIRTPHRFPLVTAVLSPASGASFRLHPHPA
jgi:hypothetical protein